MKETNENLSATTTTTTSDYVKCNGHEDTLVKAQHESDNDDSVPNTGSSSSSNSNALVPSTSGTNTNELAVLPEVSYSIRIQCSGLDVFELPVTSSELVQEIHQVLMDKEETCYRTCFSLQLEGNILDNFTELKNIENLKEGSLLKVVEGTFMPVIEFSFFLHGGYVDLEQYTVREVRIHVRHVNELIHACDPVDSYNGTNGYSLCIVNDITNGDITSNSGDEIASHLQAFF